MSNKWTDYWDHETIPKDVGRYRYALIATKKELTEQMKSAIVIMLNPSDANSKRSDSTMGKVSKKLEKEGINQIVVLNLFGMVSSDVGTLLEEMQKNGLESIVGEKNDEIIKEYVRKSNNIIVAWGECKKFKERKVLHDRIKKVMNNFSELDVNYMDRTKTGHPVHGLHWNNSRTLKLQSFQVQEYLHTFC